MGGPLIHSRHRRRRRRGATTIYRFASRPKSPVDCHAVLLKPIMPTSIFIPSSILLYIISRFNKGNDAWQYYCYMDFTRIKQEYMSALIQKTVMREGTVSIRSRRHWNPPGVFPRFKIRLPLSIRSLPGLGIGRHDIADLKIHFSQRRKLTFTVTHKEPSTFRQHIINGLRVPDCQLALSYRRTSASAASIFEPNNAESPHFARGT